MTRRRLKTRTTRLCTIGARGALLACVCVWPAVAGAEEPGQRLKQLEKALEDSETRGQSLERQAEALLEEITALQDQSIEAAEKTQNLESELTRIETMVQDLEAKHALKTAELRAQHGQLYHTLAALQRIAIRPAEAVMVSPGKPVDRLRSALLLKAAIPAIEARAAGLRGDLEELSSLRLSIEQQRSELAATAQALAEERRGLGELITRKKDLLAETEGERQSAEANAQRLAAEAENLRDLLGRIEEQSRIRRTQEARARIAEHARAQAELMARRSNKGARLEGAASGAAPEREIEGTRSLADAADAADAADGGDAETAESEAPALAALSPNVLERPNNVRAFPPGDAIPLLIMPVRGRLVGAFGQRAADADSTSKGISIETRAQAQVVAPYDGQVVYAGEFRGYGQILIIEHGGRYHTLLAGLERIDAVAGQWILAGEPIGIMGASQERSPELYLELRHAGQPVNPLPWLATTDNKVQG
jgi:septal ring factor EnvC (AmiA/AmiB activator)